MWYQSYIWLWNNLLEVDGMANGCRGMLAPVGVGAVETQVVDVALEVTEGVLE